jgi:hypothetical protein
MHPMTKNRMATDDQPSAKELTKLLKRLEVIVPIVRSQQREANRAAEVAYFAAKGTPERRREVGLVKSGWCVLSGFGKAAVFAKNVSNRFVRFFIVNVYIIQLDNIWLFSALFPCDQDHP